MKAKISSLWVPAALFITALCWGINLAGAWFEYGPPSPLNLGATGGYLLFWAVFTRFAAPSPARRFMVRTLAFLGAAGCLTALCARLFGGAWALPALLLAPFTALPLYGLRLLLSWNLTYALGLALFAAWLWWSTGLFRRASEE